MSKSILPAAGGAFRPVSISSTFDIEAASAPTPVAVVAAPAPPEGEKVKAQAVEADTLALNTTQAVRVATS